MNITSIELIRHVSIWACLRYNEPQKNVLGRVFELIWIILNLTQTYSYIALYILFSTREFYILNNNTLTIYIALFKKALLWYLISKRVLVYSSDWFDIKSHSCGLSGLLNLECDALVWNTYKVWLFLYSYQLNVRSRNVNMQYPNGDTIAPNSLEYDEVLEKIGKPPI